MSKPFMYLYQESRRICLQKAEGPCTPVVFMKDEMAFGLGVWKKIGYRSVSEDGSCGVSVFVYDKETKAKLMGN